MGLAGLSAFRETQVNTNMSARLGPQKEALEKNLFPSSFRLFWPNLAFICRIQAPIFLLELSWGLLALLVKWPLLSSSEQLMVP